MIKDGFVVLETDRLFIKRFQKIDFRNFLSIHQSPTVMKYFDGGPKTLEQSKRRFTEIMKHQDRYGFSYYNLFLKSTGDYIGQAGLYYNYDMSVNLCYAILEKYHKNGYAIEAIVEILKYGFNKLNFSVVTAMSAPENYGSRHLLEKLGAKFTNERTLFSGMHVLCYSITKKDFNDALPLLKKYAYRKAIGAILINDYGLIYMFQRLDFPDTWQAIEGGIEEGESPLDAAYRETMEEVGVDRNRLELISQTKGFIKYNFENNQLKYGFIGQEKKFFLFKFIGSNTDFSYKSAAESQEFTNHKLLSKNDAIGLVPPFKKDLYRAVFKEFNGFLK